MSKQSDDSKSLESKIDLLEQTILSRENQIYQLKCYMKSIQDQNKNIKNQMNQLKINKDTMKMEKPKENTEEGTENANLDSDNEAKDSLIKSYEQQISTQQDESKIVGKNTQEQEFQKKEDETEELDIQNEDFIAGIEEQKINENETKEIIDKLTVDLEGDSVLQDTDFSYSDFAKISFNPINTVQHKLINLCSHLGLIVSMYNQNRVDSLKLFKDSKLPEINSIILENIENEADEDIFNFLENGFPDVVPHFRFDCPIKKPHIKEYTEKLVKCLPRVTLQTVLMLWKMNCHDVCQIIKHSYNSKRVFLVALTIDGQEFDFKIDTPYKTEYLTFDYCGCDCYSDWIVNKNQLKAILIAIAQSGLSQSLKELNFCRCLINIDETKKMVNDLGMHHVEVTNRYVSHEF